MNTAIAFSNVAKVLGQRSVLHGLTFEIAPAEFVGVIGANGAGKSTLLKLALGLLTPSAGAVEILGTSPRRARGLIAYVPQRIELDADLPLRARDFVALGVDGARFGLPLPNAARRARVEQALLEVGASAFADAPVGRLSGGEQQRLAIAQAIVGRPRILLLDEPLANLDLRSAADSVALVARLRRTHDMTVLLVAHDINPLVGVCDRVLYLANGRAAIGSVDDIINETTLTALYGRPVDVLRVRDRIIVVAGEPDHALA